MDITEIILAEHYEQRRLFALLQQIGDDRPDALAAVWGRLAAFLEAHARGEELHFYPELLRRGRGAGDSDSAADETCDAIKDHNEIRNAVAAVEGLRVGSPEWRRAVAAADRANSDHMAEEERQGLADFRLRAPLQLRHELAVEFVRFVADHLEGVRARNLDPAAYVRSEGATV